MALAGVLQQAEQGWFALSLESEVQPSVRILNAMPFVRIVSAALFPVIYLSDDFNLYSDGDLNGQGGWVASGFTVEGTTVYEGVKAITTSGGAKYAFKVGAPVSDGAITVYFQVASSGNKYGVDFILREEGSADNRISVGSGFDTGFEDVKYYNGTSWVYVGEIAFDMWQSLQIQWRSSDGKARYNLNNSGWTDWDTTVTSWATLNKFIIYSWIDNTSPIYVDYIITDYSLESSFLKPEARIKNIKPSIRTKKKIS